MTPRASRSSWLPAVGLWGPRSRFCGNRLDAYLILRRQFLTAGLYPDSPVSLADGPGEGTGGADLSSSPPPAPVASIHNGRHGTRLRVEVAK